MRRLAVVSTCSRAGYRQYGRQMLLSYDRHWPADVPLLFYAEDFVPDVASRRIVPRDLLASCPELVAFKARHRENPKANGQGRGGFRLVVKWHKRRVKLRRLKPEDAFRWEAVRFSHKSFAIFHAAAHTDADVLFWLDADVVVRRDVPHELLESVVPPDCLVSYLARPQFSECSFVGYNLRHPEAPAFFAAFREMYISDRLFREREYHDSYLFDVIRRRFERQGHRTHDIANGQGVASSHVFGRSPLGPYMEHLKGGLKEAGPVGATDRHLAPAKTEELVV